VRVNTPSGGASRIALVALSLFWLLPSVVVAQYAAPPNELSIGIGSVRDQSPSQWSSAAVAALSWDWDENWRAAFVIEGEIGATSDVERCQGFSQDPPSTCYDAALLFGLRFRPTPHTSSGFSPFVSVSLGEYWKGSGADEDSEESEYSSDHFVMQGGVGLEIRFPGSIQGVRALVDYRHVFAGDTSRNQLRLLCSYVIGPRRFARRSASQSRATAFRPTRMRGVATAAARK
jgi:hypothetical protein